MISTYDIESVLEIYFYYKDFIKIIALNYDFVIQTSYN